MAHLAKLFRLRPGGEWRADFGGGEDGSATAREKLGQPGRVSGWDN